MSVVVLPPQKQELLPTEVWLARGGCARGSEAPHPIKPQAASELTCTTVIPSFLPHFAA